MEVKEFYRRLIGYCNTVPAQERCVGVNGDKPCKYIDVCGTVAFLLKEKDIDNAISSLEQSTDTVE